MDSLTQITLGAAVGEIVLGKKVGNRAMLWGAVGGTIPDLDVIFGGLMDPLTELTAHRGFSHSILFAVLGAFLCGWMIHTIYRSSLHKYLGVLGWLTFPVGIVYFISRVLDNASFNFFTGGAMIAVVLFAFYRLYIRYFKNERSVPEASLRDWQWLMFWAIFTHPLLDCFTTYGTQLFNPFTDYRVAFNTIAVADPFYTVPFLICVIAVSYFTRSNERRRRLAWWGIGISSVYMCFCIFNKYRVSNVWKDTLEKNEISYQRYMTSPSIFSNFLWTCIAETEDGYVSGQYSFFDKERKVNFEFTPRNPENISLPEDDFTLERLKWFSNGYYNVMHAGDRMQFNDLRFGSMRATEGKKHYIFNFLLEPKKDGSFNMLGANGGPPPGGEQQMIEDLITRIKGI